MQKLFNYCIAVGNFSYLASSVVTAATTCFGPSEILCGAEACQSVGYVMEGIMPPPSYYFPPVHQSWPQMPGIYFMPSCSTLPVSEMPQGWHSQKKQFYGWQEMGTCFAQTGGDCHQNYILLLQRAEQLEKKIKGLNSKIANHISDEVLKIEFDSCLPDEIALTSQNLLTELRQVLPRVANEYLQNCPPSWDPQMLAQAIVSDKRFERIIDRVLGRIADLKRNALRAKGKHLKCFSFADRHNPNVVDQIRSLGNKYDELVRIYSIEDASIWGDFLANTASFVIKAVIKGSQSPSLPWYIQGAGYIAGYLIQQEPAMDYTVKQAVERQIKKYTARALSDFSSGFFNDLEIELDAGDFVSGT